MTALQVYPAVHWKPVSVSSWPTAAGHDSQLTTPMYSTQLCIVYRWLHAAKRYFIGLLKNWGPISFT